MVEADTERLLEQAAGGDESARGRLLLRHRDRLRRMVAVRSDPRLAARVDPSDVVQDTLAEAAGKLDRYLRERPLPFYPWLRQIARERLATLNRRHVQAQRRSVKREEAGDALPDRSALALADRLFARNSNPSARLHRDELRTRVRAALASLSESDREVLVLRHLEELPAKEIAAILGTTESAIRSRQVRAFLRLRELLGPDYAEGGR